MLFIFLRLSDRLDAAQQVRNVLQEHTLHLRGCLPGHVLPLADDGSSAGHWQALFLVLQAGCLRPARFGDGHSRKYPGSQSANWLRSCVPRDSCVRPCGLRSACARDISWCLSQVECVEACREDVDGLSSCLCSALHCSARCRWGWGYPTVPLCFLIHVPPT